MVTANRGALRAARGRERTTAGGGRLAAGGRGVRDGRCPSCRGGERGRRARRRTTSVPSVGSPRAAQNTLSEARKPRRAVPPRATVNLTSRRCSDRRPARRCAAPPAGARRSARRDSPESRRAGHGEGAQRHAARGERRDEPRALELERARRERPPAAARPPLQHDLGAGQPRVGLDREERGIAGVDARRRPQRPAHRGPHRRTSARRRSRTAGCSRCSSDTPARTRARRRSRASARCRTCRASPCRSGLARATRRGVIAVTACWRADRRLRASRCRRSAPHSRV